MEVVNSTCYDNCAEYYFNEDNTFGKNVISEFHLICNDAWKASFTQSVIMFGFLIGISLFGWISDRYGRRIGLIISFSINVIFMLAAPFSPTYWIFNGVRFFVGMASGGAMVIGVVITVEVVGTQYQEVAGCLAVIPDGFCQALLGMFAYFAKDWRMYLLEYSATTVFIYLLIIVFIPETPRWLMANGKVEEALNVMIKAARRNKRDLAVCDIQGNILKACDEMMINDKKDRKYTHLDLFRTRDTALRITGSIVMWFTAGTCFFGIDQYVTFIGTDLYITVVILGCIQILVCPLSMVINKFLGSKLSLAGTYSFIGITMTLLTFMPVGHKICIILGFVGFAATNTLFGILNVYVSELFPTSLLTMALGLSSSGTKIGAMGAPFIVTINPHWITSLIFAILPFIASTFCLLLPDKKKKIPDII